MERKRARRLSAHLVDLVPLASLLEQLEASRIQLAVEAPDEVERLAGEDVIDDGGAQNCSSSVEPTSASVELSPPLTVSITASKYPAPDSRWCRVAV